MTTIVIVIVIIIIIIILYMPWSGASLDKGYGPIVEQASAPASASSQRKLEREDRKVAPHICVADFAHGGKYPHDYQLDDF